MFQRNLNIAYSVVRSTNGLVRVDTAAPRRDGFLFLRSHTVEIEQVLAFVKGHSEHEYVGLSESLRDAQLVVGQGQQLSLPAYGTLELFQECRAHLAASANIRGVLSPQVNKWFLSEVNQIPPELELRCPHSFWREPIYPLLGESILWVRDQATFVWWPQRLSRIEAVVIEEAVPRLLEGQPVDLSSLSIVAGTGIFRLAKSEAVVNATRPTLLKEIVPQLQIEPLARYYSALGSSGAMRLGDRDSTSRAWMHNERLARLLGIQFELFISRVVGYSVKAYFSHFVSYREGASLPVHRDRVPRAASLSIQLDYTHEGGVRARNEWPFSVTDREGNLCHFTPQLGEAVLFWGHEQPHFRDSIPTGASSNVLLMHFAPKTA